MRPLKYRRSIIVSFFTVPFSRQTLVTLPALGEDKTRVMDAAVWTVIL
jgi:hypothetical protein